MTKPPGEFPGPGDDREARLTALLFGELPAAEAKELAAELARDAELRALRDQLAETIGLLRESFGADAKAEAAPARFSSERRGDLLGRLRSVPVAAPAATSPRKLPWWQVQVSWVPLAAAACVVFLLAGMLLPALAKAKAKAQRLARGDYDPYFMAPSMGQQGGRAGAPADAAVSEAEGRELGRRSFEANADQPLGERTPTQFGVELYSSHGIAPMGGTEGVRRLDEAPGAEAPPAARQNVEFYLANSDIRAGQAGAAGDTWARTVPESPEPGTGHDKGDPTGYTTGLEAVTGYQAGGARLAGGAPGSFGGGGMGGFGGGGFGGGLMGGVGGGGGAPQGGFTAGNFGAISMDGGGMVANDSVAGEALVGTQGVNRGFKSNTDLGQLQDALPGGSAGSRAIVAGDLLTVASLGDKAGFGNYYDFSDAVTERAGKEVALQTAPGAAPASALGTTVEGLGVLASNGGVARYGFSPDGRGEVDGDGALDISGPGGRPSRSSRLAWGEQSEVAEPATESAAGARFRATTSAAPARPTSGSAPAAATRPAPMDESQMMRRYGLLPPQEAPAAATPAPAPGAPPTSDEFSTGYAMALPPVAQPTAPAPAPTAAAAGGRSAGQSTTWNMPVRGEPVQGAVAGGENLYAGLSEANKDFAKGVAMQPEPAQEVAESTRRGRTRGLGVTDSEAGVVRDFLARPESQVAERYEQDFDTGVQVDRGAVVTNGATPVLGDVPTLGRLFRSESVVKAEPEPAAESAIRNQFEALEQADARRLEEDARKREAEARARIASVGSAWDLPLPAPANEELAPLPLKLPVPAFMGTPMDMSLKSVPAEGPEGAEMAGRVLDSKRRGGAIAEGELERFQRVKGEGDDVSRKLADMDANGIAGGVAMGQLVSELEPAKLPELSQRLAETRSGIEVESLVERRPPVAGKPPMPAEPEPEPVKEKTLELPAQQQPLVEDLAKRLPAPPPAEPLPEIRAVGNPFSTFSLNVADVTFKLAAASLEQGQLPAPGSVRSEEFINAFDYRDPEPAAGEAVGFVWERARFPFAHNREVIRFALKTAARGRETGRPLNLVLLLDSSGSMERADRVNIVRTALGVLGTQLQPQDRLSVVTFSSVATLRADGATGGEARQALQRATEVPPEGGTNLEDALRLAYETAKRHFLNGGVNRVVVLTDGAANLGNVDPEELKALVEQSRREGVALDAFGVGWEGYNDDLLEVLTRNGDGRYGFINTPEAAATDFAGQLAGALQVAAADVKVQVEFNPARVEAYRQVGYQKHQLTKEQFRDNTVDAAEIGAAEEGNALYVAELKPEGQGPIGYLRVRYRVPATGQYEEREWLLDYSGPALRLEEAGPALRLATVAGSFAEWLSGSPFAGEVTLDRLQALLRDIPAGYPRDPRPQRLADMLQQARSLSGR